MNNVDPQRDLVQLNKLAHGHPNHCVYGQMGIVRVGGYILTLYEVPPVTCHLVSLHWSPLKKNRGENHKSLCLETPYSAESPVCCLLEEREKETFHRYVCITELDVCLLLNVDPSIQCLSHMNCGETYVWPRPLI